MRHRAVLGPACMLALLAITHGAPASAWDGGGAKVDGSIRLGWFGSSRDLDQREDLAFLSGDLSLKQSIGENHRLELKVRLLAEDVFGDRETRVDWQQATWFWRTERVDVRVGQQRVRWGKADGINPTDFFTPVDFTVLLPLEDDRHQSIPAVRADIHVNDADSLSLVAARGFSPTRIPWPKPSPFAIDDDEPSDWQAGVRWLHTGERLDWSLSAFHGMTTLPLLHAGSEHGSTRFLRHYAKLDAIGGDIARNFGGFGFRAEGAYYRRRAHYHRQSASSGYMLVAGLDRSLGNWNINVQGILNHTPDWRDPDREGDPLRRLAATQNAILFSQQKRTMIGMTARIASHWRHETLHAELLLVANASPSSVFARPMVTYALNDRMKLRAGYEYYAGNDETYFGLLKRNRTGFFEWQISY